MFTRNSTAELKALEPRSSSSRQANGAHPRSSSGEKSVIGNDLRIVGQGLKIIGRGTLQVDGDVEGDVQAIEVIVGEQGKVTGMVAGEQVVVRGNISGVICGRSVALQASSRVEGDIHHMSFAIEQGAMFEGRSRRVASDADLNAVMTKKAESATPPSLTHRLGIVGSDEG